MLADTDEVCIRALGEFGRWQLRGIFLMALVKVTAAWQMASIMFTAPKPEEFWCARTSEFLNWDDQEWQEVVQPNTSAVLVSQGERDPCSRYEVQLEKIGWTQRIAVTRSVRRPCEHFEFREGAVTRVLVGGRDPCNRYEVQLEKIGWTQRIAINRSVRRPCEQFEFREGAVTMVTEWSLVCRRQVLVAVSQFFYLVGILVGGVVFRQLLFRFSPRRVLLTAMGLQAVAGTTVSLAPQFELQVFLRFLTAASTANMFSAAYKICTEITARRWRLITGACFEITWSVGVVTLSALGYICSNWRYLQLAISLPTAFLLLAYRWIPDSPRWLIDRGLIAEAQLILEEGAAFNRRVVLAADIQVLATQKKKTEVSWSQLFSDTNHRWNCSALHLLSAVTILIYYGGLLNVQNVGKHLHFNAVMAGFAEVVGVLLGLALILWCRHKWVALGIILLGGGGTCTLSCALQNHGKWYHEWEMLGLAMTGRIAIASSLTLLQVTSSELLLLQYRGLGIFSSVTFGRICLTSAPYILKLAMNGDYVPLSLYGAMTCMGGVAALYLGRVTCKTQ